MKAMAVSVDDILGITVTTETGVEVIYLEVALLDANTLCATISPSPAFRGGGTSATASGGVSKLVFKGK